MPKPDPSPAALAALPDDELLEAVQRQTFRFFWEGAHPASGLSVPEVQAGLRGLSFASPHFAAAAQPGISASSKTFSRTANSKSGRSGAPKRRSS
jgi:hypothetical protein